MTRAPRSREARARPRSAPAHYRTYLPAPTPSSGRGARRGSRSMLPIGTEEMEEKQTAFHSNRSTATCIGLSSFLEAVLVLLFAFAVPRLLLFKCFQSSSCQFQLESSAFHLRFAPSSYLFLNSSLNFISVLICTIQLGQFLHAEHFLIINIWFDFSKCCLRVGF